MDLNDKWHEGTLTKEDVKAWAKNQSEMKGATDEELDHVATCLHHIYRADKENYPIGHFLTAVLENDFMKVCGHADSTNAKVLPIYAKFLYNIAPADWVHKRRLRASKG